MFLQNGVLTMCRFVAYLGKKSVTLNEVLDKPKNSLINQSREARESTHGLNADGFGIGWYNLKTNPEPGLFKSVQPAWNDDNLRHIASRIRSTCFIGHVRASSVGGVNTLNCHPFANQEYLFVHNGTIREFESIRRPLLNTLSDDVFKSIRGQTDSEHFFALLMNNFLKNNSDFDLDVMSKSIQQTIKDLCYFQKSINVPHLTQLNTVITDGKQMIAMRYVNDSPDKAQSLHYTIGDYVDRAHDHGLMHATENGEPGAILVSSERLNDFTDQWHDVPVNHLLLVDKEFNTTTMPI